MIEQTLAIVKPGAVRKGFTQDVLSMLHASPIFTILSQRLSLFTHEQAAKFYREHEGKDYYPGLIEHTISGPCLILVLEGVEAVKRWRQMMGATDPKSAVPGTLRRFYASLHPDIKLPDNGLHGSDSVESAAHEIGFLLQEKLI